MASNLYTGIISNADNKKLQNMLASKGVYGYNGAGAVSDATANNAMNLYRNAVINAANGMNGANTTNAGSTGAVVGGSTQTAQLDNNASKLNALQKKNEETMAAIANATSGSTGANPYAAVTGSTGAAPNATTGGTTPTTTTPTTTTPTTNTVTSLTVPGTSYIFNNDATGTLAYNQALANQQNYNTSLQNLEGAYGKYVAELQSGTNSANAALARAKEAGLTNINNAYDDSARNYYRLYRTQETKLPEQLSSMGVTGGATESAALRLLSGYSDNMYKNESGRNQETNTLEQDYQNAVAQNSAALAQQIADAYLQAGLKKMSLESDYNQAQTDLYNTYSQTKADEEAAAKVASWNSNVKESISEQLDKGNDVWTWTDSDGKLHWSIYESKGQANGGTKLDSGTKADAIDSRNTKVEDRIDEQLQKGNDVWTWYGDDGQLHWTTKEGTGTVNGGTKIEAGTSSAIEALNDTTINKVDELVKSGKDVWVWYDDDGKLMWTTSRAKGTIYGAEKISGKETESAGSGGSGGGDGKENEEENDLVEDVVPENNNLQRATQTESAPKNSDAYEYYKNQALRHLNGRNQDGIIGGADAVLNFIDRAELSDDEKYRLAVELGLDKYLQ